MVQNFVLMMFYIILNLEEIYSALRVYVETNNECSEEFLYITSIVLSKKLILENFLLSLLGYIILQ